MGGSLFQGNAAQLGIILNGVARTYLADAQRRQVTLRYARTGALVGLLSAQSGDYAAVQQQAVTDCDILEVSAAAFTTAVQSSPAVAIALIAELGQRLEEMYGLMATHAFGSMRERVSRHLMDMARKTPSGEGLVVDATQQQLADAVGTTRQVVNRVLGDLRRARIIDMNRGQIEILQPSRLETSLGRWRTVNLRA